MEVSWKETIFLSFTLLFAYVSCDSCTPGWFTYEEWCYAFGEDDVSWGDAQAICSAYGAKLAEVRTASQNDWIKSQMLTHKVTKAWLGATDIFHEGTWEWVSHREVMGPFMDWAHGKPDDGSTGEDCLHIFVYNDTYIKWNDEDCDEKAFFICQSVPYPTVVG